MEPSSGWNRNLYERAFKVKEIKLHGGNVALVDDDDFDMLNSFVWYCATRKDGKSKTKYAIRTSKNYTIAMHRQILDLKQFDKIQTDHIDRNGLNNQRNNLRLATVAQNVCNVAVTKRNKLGLKGISLVKGLFKVMLSHKRHNRLLGYFDTLDAAIACYDWAAKKYHGEFAYVNGTAQEYDPNTRRSRARRSKGYRFIKSTNRWHAYTLIKDKVGQKHIGSFKTETEAIEAVKRDRAGLPPVHVIRSFKGYHYVSKSNKWRVRVKVDGKFKQLGMFETEINAIQRVKDWSLARELAASYYGSKALERNRLNSIEQGVHE